MELQFERNYIRCLATPVQETREQEETQELKLTEGMPDIGRIIGSWGQVITRGKEWRSDSISLSGGIMVWVLYAPEDCSAPRMLDSWIPFRVKWELPDNTPEGEIRAGCLLRFVDARSVSPRKIMVRAGVGAIGQALSPMEAEVYIPGQLPEDVALLQNTYPVRLLREAGEKTFLMDEELNLPASCPAPEKILCYQLQPQITDKKVMANKVVFRGNGNLHILYASESGQLYCWDFDLPFSQYAELTGEYSPDARADISLCVTSLDLTLESEGKLRLKAGLVGQYVIDDREMVTITEDAFSPGRDVTVEMDTLSLPAVLDSPTENIFGEQTIRAEGDIVVDAQFLPDQPRLRRMDGEVQMELPGLFQILYYAPDGSLQTASARWDGSHTVRGCENCRAAVEAASVGRPTVNLGSGTIDVRSELMLKQLWQSADGMPMAVSLDIGEKRKPDPARPSLILRRAGRERLWDIAKGSGSTVDAIRDANGLQGEPSENQMLLIPVV